MPYILALLGLAGAAYFWIIRARNAAEMTHELADVASDIMAAARRFGFRRRHNKHPVEDIEDPKLAIGALGVAFLQIGGAPTQEQKSALLRSLQTRLNLNLGDAEELDVLGHWFVTQCNGPLAAIPRLARRLHKLDGVTHLETTLGVVNDTLEAGGGNLTDQQREALDEVRRGFRV